MVANEAQVNILKRGVDAWNEWRKQNPNVVPLLNLTRFRGMDFRGFDLRATNFEGSDLRRTVFREVDLRDATLRGADLSGADLRAANLKRVNAVSATFRRANLTMNTQCSRGDFSQADFEEANLRGVGFGYANLSHAEFYFSDLSLARLMYANFSGATFTGANLYGAFMRNADFTDARMDASSLGGLDLSQVTGLASVQHLGPSAVGVDTIHKSKGKIPESFLKGAGVPESFIANMKLLVGAMSPVEFYSCFISYSHADKAFACNLHDSLQMRGIRCWLDEHQLLPGDDIYHEVDRGIQLWDKMLLCCSESSLKSWWVDNEIGTAFEKEQQLMKNRGAKVQVLVPLNLDGYLFSAKWKSGYQAQVRRRLAADFTESIADNKKFDEQIERLIKALRADEDAREKPPESRL